MNIDLGPDRKNGNVKQSAYLQYLKSFSLNTMDTLKKLERQFKDDISQNLLFQPNSMFKRVRTLLNSYEVMVLCTHDSNAEINDSFEFMEVPQFGCCILKVFLQMMSIIKWALKSIVARPAVSQSDNSNHESISKKQSHRQSMEANKKQLTDNDKYKLKEQSKYLMKGLDYEMQRFQKTNQYNSHSQAIINNILSDKQRVLKIQASQSQNILEEAVKNLSKKGENILQFIQMRQNYMNYCKINAGNYTTDGFEKVKQFVEAQSAERVIKIRDRMQLLVGNCLKIHDQHRRQSMVSKCYQAHIKNPNSQTREQIKYIERLKQNVLQLQQQLNYEKQVNQGLTELLERKNNDHQSQLMKQRIDKIKMHKNNSKQQRVRLNTTPKNLTICEQFTDQPEFDRKFKKSTLKKTSKKLSSRRRLEEYQGPQQEDPIQYRQLQEINIDKLISSRSARSFRSQNHGLRFLKIDSRNLNYDYYPIHSKFKQVLGGMLTTINFQQFCRTKGCQTDNVRISDQKHIFKTEVVINQLFEGFKDNIRNPRNHKKSMLNDTQSLIKITNSNSHRQSAIKRIALNLSSRSSKMVQLIQLQRDLCALSNNQTATSTSKRPKTSVAMKSKFSTPAENKNTQIAEQIQKRFRVTCQLKNSLMFNKSDLLNLFLTEENAKNYQFLNFSYKPQKQKNPKTNSGKIDNVSQINYTEDNVNKQAIILRQKSRLFHQQIDRLVSYFIKQARKYLKQNRKLSVAIRSFIRYPYTSIRKSKQQEWIRYQKQQQQLQSWQLKKYFYRILAIHSNCFESHTQVVCNHIKKFYQKVGITIV